MKEFRIVGIYINAKTKEQEEVKGKWINGNDKTVSQINNSLVNINAFFNDWYLEYR